MGISSESILRGTLVMLPWAISFIAIWFTTNTTNPESPMLGKRNSIIITAIGLLLFITGMILGSTGILEGVIQEFRIIDVGYKVLGLILVFYGKVGRNYKLVKIKHY